MAQQKEVAVVSGLGNWLDRTWQHMVAAGIEPRLFVGGEDWEKGSQRLRQLGIPQARYSSPLKLKKQVYNVCEQFGVDHVVGLVLSPPQHHLSNVQLFSKMPNMKAIL